MQKKIIIFLVIFLLAIAEISFFSNFFEKKFQPQLVLIFLVFWSAKKSLSLFWAILGAIILDLLTFNKVGFSVIPFILIFYGINFLDKRFFVSQKSRAFFSIAVLILISTMLYNLYASFLYSMENRFFSKEGLGFLTLLDLKNSSFLMLSNLIAFGFLFWPLEKMRKFFSTEDNKLALK